MHKLLDDYLCKKYPKIFAERNLPMTQTCMCWGFECDNGWFHLIDSLCAQIQSRIDNPPNENKPDLWSKVLRFYQRKIYPHIDSFIRRCVHGKPRKDSKPRILTPEEVKEWDRKDKICRRWRNHFFVDYTRTTRPKKIHQVVAEQVKEKFGGLRFYYRGGDEYIQALVSFAEDFSYRLCEISGQTNGVGQTNGWITTCRKEFVRNPITNSERNWVPYSEEIEKIFEQIEKEKTK